MKMFCRFVFIGVLKASLLITSIPLPLSLLVDCRQKTVEAADFESEQRYDMAREGTPFERKDALTAGQKAAGADYVLSRLVKAQEGL